MKKGPQAGPFFAARGPGLLPRLRVVLLAVDAPALGVLRVLDAALLVRADVAVASGAGLLRVVARLAALEVADLAVRERPVLDALLDPLLLVDVPLHVGLHPLRGRRVRVADLRVVLLAVDVAAHLVLRAVDASALLGRELAVLQCTRFHLLDARLLALEPRGFARVQLPGLQALLDALLLVHVTLHFRAGGLRERGGRERDGHGGGGDQFLRVHRLSPLHGVVVRTTAPLHVGTRSRIAAGVVRAVTGCCGRRVGAAKGHVPVSVPSADLQLLDPDQLAGTVAGVVATERASPDEAALAPNLDQIPAQGDDVARAKALEPPRDHRRRRDEVHVRARGFDLAARDRRRALEAPVIEASGLADVEPRKDRLVRHPAPAERQVDRRETIRGAAAVALRVQDARLDPERGERRDAEPVLLENRGRALERELLGHARGDNACAAHDRQRVHEVLPREIRADRENRDGEPATHRHARAGHEPERVYGSGCGPSAQPVTLGVGFAADFATEFA